MLLRFSLDFVLPCPGLSFSPSLDFSGAWLPGTRASAQVLDLGDTAELLEDFDPPGGPRVVRSIGVLLIAEFDEK